MDYLALKDLKKTKEFWQRLERERELVITRDGQSSALMISVSPDTLDESVREIRRALFNAAVSRSRVRAALGFKGEPPTRSRIDDLIVASRRERGSG